MSYGSFRDQGTIVKTQALLSVFSWGFSCTFSIWELCKAVYFLKLDAGEEVEAKASSPVKPHWKVRVVLMGGGGGEEENGESQEDVVGVEIPSPAGEADVEIRADEIEAGSEAAEELLEDEQLYMGASPVSEGVEIPEAPEIKASGARDFFRALNYMLFFVLLFLAIFETILRKCLLFIYLFILLTCFLLTSVNLLLTFIS